MAEKRMFAKTIIDSDLFLDMPVTAQLLYFHLCMRADDDGFINNPKRIMRDVRCSDDDMKVLIAKGYIIPFESGVIVIKHWRLHNYIKNDRYKTTLCEEKSKIKLNTNKVYELLEPERNQTGTIVEPKRNHVGTIMEPQYRVGKSSIDKSRLVESAYTQTDELQPLIAFYEANIEFLTPFKLQDLQGMYEDFGSEWVQKAMEKVAGCEQSKRNNKYLRGVLVGWKKDNVPKPWENKKPAAEEQISGAEFMRREEERHRQQVERDMRLAAIARQQEEQMRQAMRD
jgi:DnaD/phage-associated family protein